MKTKEIKKLLKSGGQLGRYCLTIGGLELYFRTIKEAKQYYEQYII